jgi:hypothetical protein
MGRSIKFCVKTVSVAWAIFHFCFLGSVFAAGVTNPKTIVPETNFALPDPKVEFTDPDLGGKIIRLLNPRTLANPNPYAVPIYSQLSSWNSDMSLILLQGEDRYYIIDSSTYSVVREVWGLNSARWSPVDKDVIFYMSNYGREFNKYSVSNNSSTLIRYFSEYTNMEYGTNQEAMSYDGKYVALAGNKYSDNTCEIFAFNVIDNVKGPVLSRPLYPSREFPGDHVAISPLGDYVMVQWGTQQTSPPSGATQGRYRGLEAYDLNMNYVGEVTPHNLHGDFAVDKNGVQWYVFDYTGSQGPLPSRHMIVKARVPDGVILNADNTISNNATYNLLTLDWFINMHISCRNYNVSARGWCVASTYSGTDVEPYGWLPLRDEIFRVWLDSNDTTPHIERMAHHRTSPAPLTTDNCPSGGSYWAQPHATVSPDGTRVLFASNWRKPCYDPPQIDPFILNLPPDTGGGDTLRPAAPKGVTVR